jgi:hypothetical protein
VTGKDTLFVVAKSRGDVLWSLVVPSVLNHTIALSETKMYVVSSQKGLMVLNRL